MKWGREEKIQFICNSCLLLWKIKCILKILISFDLYCSKKFPVKTTQRFFVPNVLTPTDLILTLPCVLHFCLAFFCKSFEKKNKTLALALQSPLVIFSSGMKFKTHKIQLPFPVEVPFLCSYFIFITIWVKITISCSIALCYW